MIITYHEHNPAVAVPQDMTANGIDWRAAKFYDMAMGGAVANGTYVTDINNVGASLLTTDPTSDGADIAISWKVSPTNPKSSDITVNITAKQAFPANGKLFIIVYQTYIHWKDEYGITASNGQTHIYNSVREICGDTLGVTVPQLAVGGTHTATHNYTAAASVTQFDSLRVAVMVQDMDTKKFIKVAYTRHSPLDTGSIPIILSQPDIRHKKLNLVTRGSHQISFELPFGNATAQVFNTTGRLVAHKQFAQASGAPVTLTMPQTKGVYVLRLRSEKGEKVAVKIPFRE